MKSLSPFFLTQNASALQWSFALIVLDLIVGSFFANQGYWDIESTAAEVFFNTLSAYLYLCVLYRILRPQGSEHLQVMRKGKKPLQIQGCDNFRGRDIVTTNSTSINE